MTTQWRTSSPPIVLPMCPRSKPWFEPPVGKRRGPLVVLVLVSMGSADVRKGIRERTKREENSMGGGREKSDPNMIINVGQFSAADPRRFRGHALAIRM